MSNQPPGFEELYFNGLDAGSGNYLLPTLKPAEISELALGEKLDKVDSEEARIRKFNLNNPHMGVEADARKLEETGWGVVFPTQVDPAVVEALQPLLSLRKSQAGKRYREFSGGNGVLPDESKTSWLERHGMGPGPANPDKVPYYLLLVGSPEKISFRFQQQLDVQYAVGRISFAHPEEYAQYAASVVLAESGLKLQPRAAFFGVANADDKATQLSADYLVAPLADRLLEKQAEWLAKPNAVQPPEWRIDRYMKAQATKQNLGELLNAKQAPALFFSASHGAAFPKDPERQLSDQGALVCQDWEGPEVHRGPIPESAYFAGRDLNSDANLLGSISFLFACYGAGTPQIDEFAGQIWKDQPERKEIAPNDFIASLPMRMLSLPRGGALAVVGHVDRAWGLSFFWGSAGAQLQVFEDCFTRLLKDNYPLGYALEVFNNRYAEISSELTHEIEQIKKFFRKVDHLKLSRLWTANNDARNTIILGDPAVRLSVGSAEQTNAERPVIALEAVAAGAASGVTGGEQGGPVKDVTPQMAARQEPKLEALLFEFEGQTYALLPDPQGGVMRQVRRARLDLLEPVQLAPDKLSLLLKQALEAADKAQK